MVYIVAHKSVFTKGKWMEIKILHSKKSSANKMAKLYIAGQSPEKLKKIKLAVKVVPVDRKKPQYNQMTVL